MARFRIEHWFVSVGVRLAKSVAYVSDGLMFVGAERPETALSDHATLLVDC